MSSGFSMRRVKRIERRCRPRGLIQVLLLIFAFALGSWVTEYQCQHALERTQYYKERYQDKTDELSQQLNLVAKQNLELHINAQSQDKLKLDLQKQIAKNADLFNDNAFYKSVLAPESNVKGVYIKDLYIYPTQIERHYSFSLLLSQFDRRRENVSGSYQLMWIGEKDGKRVIYDLKDVQVKKNKAKFNFKYYQELTGEVELPAGFNLERIHVLVKVPGNRWRKAKSLKRQWKWKDVLIKDSP